MQSNANITLTLKLTHITDMDKQMTPMLFIHTDTHKHTELLRL